MHGRRIGACLFLTLVGCSSGSDERAAELADAGVADAGGDATGTLPDAPAGAAGWKSGFAAEAVGLRCAMSRADMAKAASVTVGDATIFVGYEQASSTNQNPLVARFEGDKQTFCVSHEKEPPDGRALGITWDGGPIAYVVFTVVGGGTALDAAAKSGWLTSYGAGGGSKVTFLGRIDAASGALQTGTFVIAKKKDGKTNSHSPTSAPIRLDDGRIELRGSSAFQPMNPDRSLMTCADYPFDTRYVFRAELDVLDCSSSTNCVGSKPCP